VDYERPPSDQQRTIVEEPRLDIPLKVVAGAGTGKTFVLAHRFVWLVTTGKVGGPERILTLTFTDNAAAEMRLRIKRLLQRNGQQVTGDLWIHTFHSFAARLIGECSYQVGLSPDPQLLTEIRQTVELESLLDGVLAGDLAQIDILRPQRLAQLGFDNPQDLRDLLRLLIQRTKRYGLTPEQFRQQALEATEGFWEAMPSAPEAWELGNDRQIPATLQSRLLAALKDPAINQAPVEEARPTADLRKLYYQDLTKKTPRSEAPAHFEREQQIEQALIEVAYAAYGLYQQRLASADMIDFDDQIMMAVQLLTDPALALAPRYRQQFDYILVDEFQDTSPAQMVMVEALAHPAELTVSRNGQSRHISSYSRLMVVGDQKQSIYAWRNARPENLDRLLPFGAGDTVAGSPICRPLTGTYRLDQHLTVCANRAGQRARAKDPPLESVSAEPGVVVRVAPFVPGEGETGRHARRRQAAYIAEKIQQFVQEQGNFDYGDICVLMRRRWEFRHLKKAFEDRQIPYQAQGGVGFFDHPLARDVLAFLQVVDNPYHDQSWIRLLTRPPVSLNDRQLFLLVTLPDQESEDVLRRSRPPIIASLQRFVAEGGPGLSPQQHAELPTERLSDLLELITDLRQQSLLRPAREVLERTLEHIPTEGLTPPEQVAAPAVKATLAAIIEELSAERPPADVGALVRALQLYQQQEGLQLPAADLPVHNAVQVMTIHRAKGLGFGALFVLAWSPRSRPPLYDETWGLVKFKVDGEKPAKQICHRLFGSHGDELEEEARLWYVALTRAKHFLCVTFVAGPRKGEDIPWAEDLAGSSEETGLTLAEQKTPGPGYSHIAPLLPQRLPSEAQPPRQPAVVSTSFTALQTLLACPLRWWIAVRWRPGQAFSDPAEDTSGLSVGTAFHAYAAACYRGGALPDEAYRQHLTQSVLTEADALTTDRLEALIAAFAASPWPQLRPAGEDVERPVHLIREVDGLVIDIMGVVDLLLPQQDQFIDFKTNRYLDDSDLASYALQMYIYQQALLSEPGVGELSPLIVHVTEDELREMAVTDDLLAGQDERLNEALTQLAHLTRASHRPSPPSQPPCEHCPFADFCPDTPLRPGDRP